MATKPTLPPSIWAENRPALTPPTDSQWGQGFEYTSTTSGGKALTETFDYPLFKIDESLRWLRDLFDDNGAISGLPDATTTQKGVVKKATTEDVQSGTDDEKYVTPASVNAALINMVGFLMFRTVSTTPSGRWIKANGFEISRTTYADLFSEASSSDNFISQATKDADPEMYAGYYGDGDGSTTFTLPDLRGEFVRGWDDGRGIDAGRAFGSWQADELVNHDHGLNFKIISNRGDTEGRSGKVASGTTKTKSFGGDETRPRNIALIAWIRY